MPYMDDGRRKAQSIGAHRKIISALAKRILSGMDRKKAARFLRVKPETLDRKVATGRFTATELSWLAELNGYFLTVEKADWIEKGSSNDER